MDIAIRTYLLYFVIGITLLIAIIFIRIRKSCNNQEKAFGYFISLNASFELIAWFSAKILGIKNNLLGLHIYTLLEFLCISLFAIGTLKSLQGRPSKIILLVGSLFIIANSIWIQDIYTYNSISITGVKIFTLIVSVMFFHKILSSRKYSIFEVRPSVYFFTAIFLNACNSMIWFMYSNKILLLNGIMRDQLKILRMSVSIFASLIIITGLYFIIIRNKADNYN